MTIATVAGTTIALMLPFMVASDRYENKVLDQIPEDQRTTIHMTMHGRDGLKCSDLSEKMKSNCDLAVDRMKAFHSKPSLGSGLIN